MSRDSHPTFLPVEDEFCLTILSGTPCRNWDFNPQRSKQDATATVFMFEQWYMHMCMFCSSHVKEDKGRFLVDTFNYTSIRVHWPTTPHTVWGLFLGWIFIKLFYLYFTLLRFFCSCYFAIYFLNAFLRCGMITVMMMMMMMIIIIIIIESSSWSWMSCNNDDINWLFWNCNHVLALEWQEKRNIFSLQNYNNISTTAKFACKHWRTVGNKGGRCWTFFLQQRCASALRKSDPN